MTRVNMNPFILPERSTPDKLEDEYDHKAFKQWISDLPIGNVGNVARSLHYEINRHNRLDMSPLERFEAMQMMLPALAFVREGLWSHYASKPFPLSKENRLIARLHLELLVGVVVAYKTVMSQFHSDSFTGHLLHKRTRSESVRHALFFLAEILSHEYAIYRASPKFVWRELHGIYHYAVINDLRLNEIEVTDDDAVDHMTVDDIYKRILLLALTDPGSLLRGEITRVSDALIDWLPEIPIIPVGSGMPSPSVFIVDATKDAPPHVTDKTGMERIKIGWFLLTDRLNEILDQEISEIRGRSKSKLRPVDLVTATLFAKLRKRWTPDAVLREERTDGSGVVEVISGIESLHWLFGGWKLQQEIEDEPDDPIDTWSGDEESDDRPVRTLERDEFIIDADPELIAAIGSAAKPKRDEVEANGKAQDEVEVDFYNAVADGESSGEECTCVNQSKRGYYLTWTGEGEYQAHVGELIGVNSRDNLDFDSSWRLGIIRWMRMQSSGLMGFGIELLDGDIESIRLDSRHTMDSAPNPTLGFQQKINGRIDTLVTRPFLFNKGDKLMLTTVDGEMPVVPGETIECTDAFIRFKIHFDSHSKGKTKKAPTKNTGAEDIFNNIWDDL